LVGLQVVEWHGVAVGLLHMAELKALRVSDELHQLARRLPVVEMLRADSRAVEVLIETRPPTPAMTHALTSAEERPAHG
jgi:hypothetical protein